MARRKGLENFNLVLIRYLMRQQKKDTTALAAEIEYSVSNLSKVLNRQSPLSEPMGKALAEALGVTWDLIKLPEVSPCERCSVLVAGRVSPGSPGADELE